MKIDKGHLTRPLRRREGIVGGWCSVKFGDQSKKDST